MSSRLSRGECSDLLYWMIFVRTATYEKQSSAERNKTHQIFNLTSKSSSKTFDSYHITYHINFFWRTFQWGVQRYRQISSHNFVENRWLARIYISAANPRISHSLREYHIVLNFNTHLFPLRVSLHILPRFLMDSSFIVVSLFTKLNVV
jgi:hypothetical protein